MGADNQKYVHHENLENMKTINKIIDDKFDAVGYMRSQRNRLTDKLSKMTKSQIIEYFNNRKLDADVKPCA